MNECGKRSSISGQISGLLGKYYLEGYNEFWITPSGRAIDPHREHSQITKEVPEEVLFDRGFVRAEIFAYDAQRFSVRLCGLSKTVKRLEREFPENQLVQDLNCYRVATAACRPDRLIRLPFPGPRPAEGAIIRSTIVPAPDR
jgi:hypothetical protein